MATSYLTPGVYVEEVSSSSGTLSAGATAIAAFVGFTEKAPTDDPTDHKVFACCTDALRRCNRKLHRIAKEGDFPLSPERE